MRCCALSTLNALAPLRSLHVASARTLLRLPAPASRRALLRLHSSAAAPLPSAAPLAAAAAAAADAAATIPGATQADADGFYVLMFTCRKCETRTARRISKHGYHHGSVLVRCPGCLGLHLIADHLGFFSDEAVDAEDLLRARGEGGGARADASVYELSAQDAAVLASAGRSVRLSDGAQLPVVDFSGAAPGSTGGSGSGGGGGGGGGSAPGGPGAASSA
jgi:hypothetical protein